MKAALLTGPGQIVVDDIADPELGPDDVRIAVGGVGLCGSDLSVFSGRWTAPSYPWVMGHEAFGTIEAVGDLVPSERIGATVVIEPNVACLACAQCQRGRTSACVERQSVGMNRPGALAEKLVVPKRFAWNVDADLSPERLVCVEPMAVVLAAIRRLGAQLPPRALVVGVGAQGLLMSLVLIDRGVEVHVLDVNPDRVELACSFGARQADPAVGPFELVVDTVGSPRSLEAAIDQAEVGGTILILGLDNRPLDITAQTIVRRQLVLRGSLTYDHPGDFESAIALMRSGAIEPERIVTDEHALDGAQDAFDGSVSAPGKTWIRVAS